MSKKKIYLERSQFTSRQVSYLTHALISKQKIYSGKDKPETQIFPEGQNLPAALLPSRSYCNLQDRCSPIPGILISPHLSPSPLSSCVLAAWLYQHGIQIQPLLIILIRPPGSNICSSVAQLKVNKLLKFQIVKDLVARHGTLLYL